MSYYDCLKEFLEKAKPKNLILTSCAFCGILFLTSNSNKNRSDILCPFGCRHSHKKHKSECRVKKYRKTKEGKMNKKKLNEKRYRYQFKENLNDIKVEKEHDSEYNDTFMSYSWFVFKNTFFKSKNKGSIYRIYNFFNKILKNRDNTP